MSSGDANGAEVVVDSAHTAMAVASAAMVMLAATRGGHHVFRIQHYVRSLAQRLQAHPKFETVLTNPYIEMLFHLAPLHDLGMIGVPDWIQLKPENLTSEECAVMKTHTTLAHGAIGRVEKNFLGQSDSVKTLKEIVLSHHEKWDGNGYPESLSGEQIPVAARLMSIAHEYDTMTSNHIYKSGVPHEQAARKIFQGRGTDFDPEMVDAFIEIQDEFRTIAVRYPDSPLDMQRQIEYMANAIAEQADLFPA